MSADGITSNTGKTGDTDNTNDAGKTGDTGARGRHRWAEVRRNDRGIARRRAGPGGREGDVPPLRGAGHRSGGCAAEQGGGRRPPALG